MPDSGNIDVGVRRAWQRAPEAERRADLIQATIDCVADGGIAAATVREVAARAGVSNGLIRHHFASKEALVQAAYQALVEAMNGQAEEAARAAPPEQRLACFITANTRPPVLDARSLSAWAGFVGSIHCYPVMAAIHRAGYLRFCEFLQSHIAAHFTRRGRPLATSTTARHARQIAALIDGLWLEGCLAPDLFADGDLAKLALDAAGRLLDTDLTEPEPLT